MTSAVATKPVWAVNLVAEGINITAKTDNEAASYIKEDFMEYLSSWNFDRGDILRVESKTPGTYETPTYEETSADGDLRQFRATLRIYVEADDSTAAFETVKLLIKNGHLMPA